VRGNVSEGFSCRSQRRVKRITQRVMGLSVAKEKRFIEKKK